MYVQKLKIYVNYNNSYNALTAPLYSRDGEHCAHGETKTLELKKPKNSLFLFNRNKLERNWEQNSHSYKDVHDKKKYKNMDSHSRKNVHDENTYNNNMNSHLYKNVNDENP